MSYCLTAWAWDYPCLAWWAEEWWSWVRDSPSCMQHLLPQRCCSLQNVLSVVPTCRPQILPAAPLRWVVSGPLWLCLVTGLNSLFLWASIRPSPSTLPQPSQSPRLLLGPWASQYSLPSMRSSWPLFRASCVDISPVLHLPRPGSALSQCRSFGGDTRTVKHNRAKSQGLHQFFKHEVSPSIHFQGQAFRKLLPGLMSDIGYTKRENPK